MEIIDFSELPLLDRMGFIGKLNTKVLKVQSKLPTIPKSGYNPQNGGYNYATEADVINSIRPLMDEFKVLVKPSVLNVEEETAERGHVKTRVDMVFALIDVETGYIEYSYFTGVANDFGDKGLYKAYTGCHKYYLMKTFNIETGDDVEGDGITGEGVQVTATTKPKGNKHKMMQAVKKQEKAEQQAAKKKNEKEPPRGTTGTPKVISGELVADIVKLIRDYLTLDPSGTKDDILNKLRGRESIGHFEKVESMTEFQGVHARDQLKLWYNRKLQDFESKNKRQEQEPVQEKTEEQQPGRHTAEPVPRDDDDPFKPRRGDVKHG